MSEQNAASTDIKLKGLLLFKEGMATVFNDKGEAVNVTVLRYEPNVVTQVKTKSSDGYDAVQVSVAKTSSRAVARAQKSRLEKLGLVKGAKVSREIRQSAPEGVQVGQKVALASVAAGDLLKVTGVSKGHGFAGVVKRWSFEGGRASHGRGFLRAPGSVGNRTEPGRVMPGKRFPGHYGAETVSCKNVEVIDVMEDKNLLLVKGPVPGARNGLIVIEKVK
jgi:large subunit ribosomal protein L3